MAVTRTPTVENPGAIIVDVTSGQFLHFIVDAGGPKPIFTLASNENTLLNASGNPKNRYESDHLNASSGIPEREEAQLELKFLTNSDYTYTVELRDSSGVLKTLLQVSYTGNPTDIHRESFMVVTK